MGVDRYKQFGNSDYNKKHDNWSSSGTKWCRTWRLRPRSGFVFTQTDDRLGAHRIVRSIERKTSRRVPKVRKERWLKHVRKCGPLPTTRRVSVVFRRLPEADLRKFDRRGRLVE